MKTVSFAILSGASRTRDNVAAEYSRNGRMPVYVTAVSDIRNWYCVRVATHSTATACDDQHRFVNLSFSQTPTTTAKSARNVCALFLFCFMRARLASTALDNCTCSLLVSLWRPPMFLPSTPYLILPPLPAVIPTLNCIWLADARVELHRLRKIFYLLRLITQLTRDVN
jgi:hypothetical protein